MSHERVQKVEAGTVRLMRARVVRFNVIKLGFRKARLETS